MNKATIPAVTIVIALFAIVLSLPPIAQDPNYHAFGDQNSLLGIPHALNVLSNLPYLLVGVLALRRFATGRFPPMSSYRRGMLMIFFGSIGLLAFGSSIYHLQPDNTGLLLDRLCMALAFGSYLLVLTGDYLGEKISALLAPGVLLFALGSVVYWYLGERDGQGDLRFYVVVQLMPVLLTPLLAGLCERKRAVRRLYWLITLCYLLAKWCEYYDVEVFNILGLISGHSLKHLISAFAVYLFYRVQINRGK